ncbi:InlB B-repeat-containing protein [Butyrivibrio sp. VCD2006]|uniref:InlB B-repeat-containing protein n=1 Tax=Butyrivibrio sp. VCD2006 TaxID=1280664 RepID=UPI000479E884|nr:InlB B-repeat-containing protein [Butyrivibrio sp. VCD2006]
MKNVLCRAFFVAFCCAMIIPASHSARAASTVNSADDISLNIDLDTLPTGDLPEVKEPKVEEIELSAEEFEKLKGGALKPKVRNSRSSNKGYYYNQLTEVDKIYYDGILELCRQNKSPFTGTFSKDTLDKGVLFYSGTKQLNGVDWSTIIHALWYDHPEELETILFSQQYAVISANSGGKWQYNYYMYNSPDANYTGEQVAQMESELKSACDLLYNSLDLSGDDASKELAIHDALIETAEYNYDSNNKYLKYTAYGALVDKLPVCQGYATAFKMLMDKAGIETHVVAGTGDGGGHAWNVVKLGSDYYEVDTTWDDHEMKYYPYGYLYLHRYFNCTTDQFAYHTFKIPGISAKATSHVRNSGHMGYINAPVANGTRYTYNNIKKAYRVDFDGVKKGAYFYLPYQYTYTYEGKIVEMPRYLSLSGCTFNNWYTEKNGGTVVTANTTINSDITLYARWNGADNVEDAVPDKTDSYTITLHNNYDNKTDTINITKGKVVGELPIIYRFGYDFNGWSESKNGGSTVDPNKVVNSDLDFYAQWKPARVKVNFYEDSGSYSVRYADFGSTYGDAMSLGSDYQKAGHTLIGWYESFDSEKAISPDKIIDSTKPLNFYAHWKTNTYILTYDANGGSFSNGETSDTENAEYDTYISLGTHEKPLRDGYVFTGWNTSKDATNGVTSYKVTGDTTLYAIWKKACVVTLHYNYDDKTENIAIGECIYYELPKPERYGYNFIGWKEEGDTGPYYASATTIYKDIDFYAVWRPKKVNLHFNSTIGTPSNQSLSVNFGSTFGEAFDRVTNPSMSGYKFEGWTDTAINDNENVLSRDTVIDSTDSYNFYAKFTQSNCTITLHYDYDDKTEKIEVVEGTYYELPKPERYGFTFVGWREGERESNILGTTIRKDTDFYAKWSQKQVNLYFFSSTGTPSLQTLTVALGSTYGEAFDKVTEPYKAGYTFEGWTDSYASDEIISSDKVFDDINSYTFYSKLTQTTNDTEETTSTNDTEETTSTNDTEETASSNNTEETTSANDTKESSSANETEETLGDEESKLAFTVTYHALEGSFSNKTNLRHIKEEYYSRVDLSAQEVPVRDGYEFLGWTREPGSDILWAYVTIYEDIDMYAVWNEILVAPGQETHDLQEYGNENQQNQTWQESAEIPGQEADNDLQVTDPVISEDEQLSENGIIEYGGNEYGVSQDGTAVLTVPNSKNVSSMSSGEYVYYGGKNYKVTEIDRYAYKNCKKLKSARIGANIEKIGNGAFSGCKKLSKIVVDAKNLKSIGKGSFKGINNKAKITIICKDKKDYKKFVKLFKKAGAKKAKFKFKKG